MAVPREHQRDAKLVGNLDDLVVANRAAGWMTAVQPAAATTSSESGNGMNASDAHTLPGTLSPAFSTAILAESTRLICPAPTPIDA